MTMNERNRLLDIIAMSMERQKIIERLSDNRALQFAHHCGYLLLFGQTQDVVHWAGEMLSFCDWIQNTTIKPNNRPIEYELIMEHFFTYDDEINTFSNMLDRAYYEEKHENRKKDNDKDRKMFVAFRIFCGEIGKLLADQKLNRDNLLDNIYHYLVKIEEE